MQLHELKPKTKKKKRKRIGRGGKRGTYSGKGMKGQRSRAGKRMAPAIREVIKRYPKLRGYRFNPRHKSLVVLNLDLLEDKFKAGEEVSPQLLLEKKLIRKMKGRMPKVKILAKGKIKKALNIKGCLFSDGAKKEIEKANGTIN